MITSNNTLEKEIILNDSDFDYKYESVPGAFISIALPVHLHFDCGIVSCTGDTKSEFSIIVAANKSLS